MQLPYEINFIGWEDKGVHSGDVITRDGEYLGTWKIDENDHPSFVPDGETEELFFNPFLGLLIDKIRKWHIQRSEDGKH